MTIPTFDPITWIALGALALAVLYSLGLFDRLLGRPASPAPVPAPAPQPPAPVFYASDTPPPDPYALLLDYHAQVTRAADILAAQRVYHNAVTGRSVGREADMVTTFAPPPTTPAIPLPPPAPTIEAPTAATTTSAKARTTAAAKKAAK